MRFLEMSLVWGIVKSRSTMISPSDFLKILFQSITGTISIEFRKEIRKRFRCDEILIKCDNFGFDR